MKNKRELSNFFKFLTSDLFSHFKIVVLVVLTAAMFAWLVPYTRGFLEHYSIFNKDTLQVIVAAALVFTLLVLSAVSEKLSEVSSGLKALMGVDSGLIAGGVGQVYPHLLRALQEHKGRGQHSLEVLGLTLHTTWSPIRAWIKDGTMRNTKITLYCLDPDFIRTQPGSISPLWADWAQLQINSINEYLVEQAAEVRTNAVSVELFLHRNFPAMHGFRLDGEEIFISFTQWTGDLGVRHLDYANQFYERFPEIDQSARAEEYRNLFSNWVTEARARSKASPLPGRRKIELA